MIPKVINEGDTVNLNANINDVIPGCSVIWCFKPNEDLSPTNIDESNICSENKVFAAL